MINPEEQTRTEVAQENKVDRGPINRAEHEELVHLIWGVTEDDPEE